MYEWGSSRGPTATPSPSRPRPCSCPISKQGPSFSCCWRGNPLFSRRDWSREQEWLWRVEKKGQGQSPVSLGLLQGTLGYRTTWKKSLLLLGR